MTWVSLGAAAVGTVGSLVLNSGGGNSPTTTTQSSGSTSTQGSYVPNAAEDPIYGFMLGNTAQLMQQPQPYFPGQTYVSPSGPTQQGVNMAMSGLPYYGQGAEAMAGASPYYQQAAGYGQMSIPAMLQMLGTMGGNYNFLSSAADVANNPYVQDQLAANKQQVTQALTEEWLPAVNQGAQAVNAMGSSRQGIAQAQATERAAQQLANANASTMLNAYGQGLGAQTSALGQTGNMLQNLMAPGMAQAWSGDQMKNAGGALGQAGALTGAGSQQALGAGQTVEGYQQQALQDAMNRFLYQYQQPWANMQNAGNILGMLQPLGLQTTMGAQSGYNQQPNPNYMSPYQSAMGGASLGYGLYNAYNQSNQPAYNPYVNTMLSNVF